MDLAPSSPPPLAVLPRSPGGIVDLPASVEEMIGRVCRDQGVLPPEPHARKLLADLGEVVSMDILRKISNTKVQKSFTGYIIHLGRNADVSPCRTVRAHTAQDGVSLSSYSSPSPNKASLASILMKPFWEELLKNAGVVPERMGMTNGHAVPDEASSLPSRFQMHLRATTSPELIALGELEFRKAFLVLSYIGNKKLEDMVSTNMIREWKTWPMLSFEEEIWRRFGRHCICDSERRHNHDWDSEMTNLFYCHIDLDGQLTFKGPYLQRKKSHLQTILGDENVLVVKFSENGSRYKGRRQHIQLYTSVYKKYVREGIPVGLRLYRFFVFKDGGKEEKKDNPTSSPVKCYFVRTESRCAIDKDKPYILQGMPIHEARNIFMHVHKVKTIAKYMPRFSLILSKTIKLEVDFASVNIMPIDDVPCKDENGSLVYNEDGELMIHTDGTGYISEDLALKCPRNIYKGNYSVPRDVQRLVDNSKLEDQSFLLEQCYYLLCAPPLLIQVRLFFKGSAIKGTLLVNKKLPPQTIHVRPSMIKVDVDREVSNVQCANSLEVVGTSNLPKKSTTLSRHLIAHLHYGAVPRKFFLELLSSALLETENARLSKRAALKVALRHSDMDEYLVVRMILCGIPMDEPFLQFRLSVLMREEKKSLKEGKLPLSDCYYLMGTADPTGRLKSNEVCIILDKGQVSGDVLVYKHPGLHFGDIHVLTATYVKGLEDVVGNAKYAIFFPTQGSRSLAYEIANSDFDGDMYWVSMNEQLLRHFRPSAPWTGASFKGRKCNQRKPSEYSMSQLEDKLFDLFLETRFTPSYCMSTASDSWLAFMDRLLTLGDDCEEEKQILRDKMLKLVDIYYDALDAPKQGLKVEVPESLRAEKYPHFLEKKSSCTSYNSTSILGEIFDKVNSSQTDSKKEVWKLTCFEGEAPRSMETWREHYEQYRKEMQQALMVRSKEIKDAAADAVIQKYKNILYGAADLEDCTRKEEDVFDEALSIYHICYDYAKQRNDVGKCTFAWRVAGQALCCMYPRKQGKGSIVCSADALREVLG